MKIASILLALFLVGCAERGSGDWQIYIDPNFSPEEQSLVQEGIANWQECTKGVVYFSYTKDWRTDHDFILISPTTLQELTTATENTESETLGHCDSDGTVKNIQVAVNLPPWIFLPVLMHETGHALSLQHSDPGTLMYKDNDGGANHLTHKDLEQFCEIWECDPKDSACW